MRCRTVLTRVDAHRTGELERLEADELERHIETCTSCNESLNDVDALAAAMKDLVLTPPRSCRETVHNAVCDSYDVVESKSTRVRVAFSGNSVRMIDASTDSDAAFRTRYASRFAKELVEASLPPAVRRAVENVLDGQPAKLPPIDLSGTTEFEREVLETLKSIPRGEVRSYEWVAARIGRPRAMRAVGNALGNNPVPLLLPCHRVLPSSGGVGGYAFGPAMKRSLLEAEGAPLAELESFGKKGIRFIGSATTKIFCVPSCRDAQRIREKNVVPFRDAEQARDGGFRPCRHCMPVAVGA